jgi:hypothetical protein
MKETTAKKKPWRPQIGPFIQKNESDSNPHRTFQALSFTRSMLHEQTGQGACRIASNYLEADARRIAYELGRALAFGWTDAELSEQFRNGLREGFNGGGK